LAHIYIVDLAANVFEKLPGDGIEIVNEAGDQSYMIYKAPGIDKMFYSPDGYYPTLVGNALITHEFFHAINKAKPNPSSEMEGIGMAIKDYDIVTSILPVDSYNLDADGDGFVASPGVMTTTTSSLYAPRYDESQIGGWIDCNDQNADVLPFYVDPDSSCGN
jgi:hypothetical protein